jgi:hypothetical protein
MTQLGSGVWWGACPAPCHIWLSQEPTCPPRGSRSGSAAAVAGGERLALGCPLQGGAAGRCRRALPPLSLSMAAFFATLPCLSLRVAGRGDLFDGSSHIQGQWRASGHGLPTSGGGSRPVWHCLVSDWWHFGSDWCDAWASHTASAAGVTDGVV